MSTGNDHVDELVDAMLSADPFVSRAMLDDNRDVVVVHKTSAVGKTTINPAGDFLGTIHRVPTRAEFKEFISNLAYDDGPWEKLEEYLDAIYAALTPLPKGRTTRDGPAQSDYAVKSA